MSTSQTKTSAVEQQISFFTCLFDDLKSGEFIQLAEFSRGSEPKDENWLWHEARDVDTAVKICQTITLEKPTVDIFVGVLPRTKRGGSREAVAKTGRFVWADIDDPANILWKALPPSMVVYSGRGLHVYWRLRDRVSVEEIEKLNRRMDMVGMDKGTYAYNRVLRVPGTNNNKYKPPKLCGLLLDFKDHTFDYTVKDVHVFQTLDAALIDRIVEGSMIGFKKDRSRRDYSVIMPLIEAGGSEELLYRIFENNAIGTKMGDPRHGDRYFEISIDNALKKVAEAKAEAARAITTAKDITSLDDLPPEEPNEHKFTLRRDGTYYDGRRVASFVFKPFSVIQSGDAQNITALVGDLLGPTGRQRLTLDAKALHSVKDILTALPGFNGTWLGNRDTEVRQYAAHLVQEVITRTLPRVAKAACYGRHGHVFLTQHYCIGPNGPYDINDFPLLVDDPSIYGPPVDLPFPTAKQDPIDGVTTAALVKDVARLLPMLNRPSVIWPLIGWYFATPWSPIFRANGFPFPLMSVYGIRGAGKTALQQQIFLPLFGNATQSAGALMGKMFEIDSKEFVLMKLLASTNASPVVLGDFRRSYTTRAETVFRLALELYDQTTAARGRSTQTVKEYALKAPVLVYGEDLFVEETGAMYERLLAVELTDKTVEPGTTANAAFQELRRKALPRVAPHYILYTLNNDPKFHVANELVTRTFSLVKAERVLNNLTVCLAGIMGYIDFCQHAGATDLPLIDEAWVRKVFNPMLNILLNQHVGRSKTLCDEFVEELLSHLSDPFCNLPWQFDPKTGLIAVGVNEALAWWRTARSAQRRTHLEFRAMMAQLNERRGGYVSDITQMRIKSRRARYYCVILDPKKANEMGLSVPIREEGD